jgi:hypothetical protein
MLEHLLAITRTLDVLFVVLAMFQELGIFSAYLYLAIRIRDQAILQFVDSAATNSK